MRFVRRSAFSVRFTAMRCAHVPNCASPRKLGSARKIWIQTSWAMSAARSGSCPTSRRTTTSMCGACRVHRARIADWSPDEGPLYGELFSLHDVQRIGHGGDGNGCHANGPRASVARRVAVALAPHSGVASPPLRPALDAGFSGNRSSRRFPAQPASRPISSSRARLDRVNISRDPHGGGHSVSRDAPTSCSSNN